MNGGYKLKSWMVDFMENIWKIHVQMDDQNVGVPPEYQQTIRLFLMIVISMFCFFI